MKYFTFLFISLLFIGCDNTEDVKTEPTLIGSWMLVSQSDKKNPTRIGYSFSEDHQYFNLDSQGQTISRFRPKYWDYRNDTLKLVDTNVEPHLLDTKGTKTFVVDELTEDLLIMISVGEQYEIRYSYKKN
jgi:hypothetical protein